MCLAATLNPPDFVVTYVLGGPAYAFGNDQLKYTEFIAEISGKLEATTDQVVLIGSAKIGFSLNKDHLLKPFDRRSDLDLVVVEPTLFDSATLEMRSMQKELELAGQEERRRLRKTRENVFNGYLRPDNHLAGSWSRP